MFDHSKLKECPTLVPNAYEFSDPINYLSRLDIKELGLKYGILKIRPPQGWKSPFVISPEFRFHTRLQKLSDLGITTRSRKFFMESLNRFIKMKRKKQLPWYFTVSGVRVYYYDLFNEVESQGGWRKVDWTHVNHAFGVDAASVELKANYASIKPYADFLSAQTQSSQTVHSKNNDQPSGHTRSHSENPFLDVLEDDNANDDNDDDNDDENVPCVICQSNKFPEETLLCDGCDDAYHLKCVDLIKIPTGSWFCNQCLVGTGEYGFEEELERKFSLDEFFNTSAETQSPSEPLDVIEEKFWNLIEEQNGLEVRYGADIHNSIPGQISGFPMTNNPLNLVQRYDPNVYNYYANHSFNLNNLPFAKGSLLNYVDHSISGMTIPWLYIGAKYSTFCWHVEDHYTFSANYCHFGATKKWYGIPASHSGKFEELMKSQAPDLFKKQPDLLHQLVTLISPMKLLEHGIDCYYADQNPNELIITYPKVYHAGFNSGFNFNEAVNFTSELWLDYGEAAIEDYKPLNKENVFNHYKLLENILVNFVVGKESNLGLVQKCLQRYKKYVATIKHRINSMNVEVIDKGGKIKYEVHKYNQDTNWNQYTQENNDDDNNDNEIVCDQCKTNIYHSYCEIGGPHLSVNKITISQLLTPESSPQNASVASFTVPQKRQKLIATEEKVRIVCLDCGLLTCTRVVMPIGMVQLENIILQVESKLIS